MFTLFFFFSSDLPPRVCVRFLTLLYLLLNRGAFLGCILCMKGLCKEVHSYIHSLKETEKVSGDACCATDCKGETVAKAPNKLYILFLFSLQFPRPSLLCPNLHSLSLLQLVLCHSNYLANELYELISDEFN